MPLGRVLVVDDEPEVAATLRDALEELGCVVEVALSGRHALERVAAFAPDVVLLDVLMPDMPGDQVLERLRRDHPRVPVVMVTGQQDEDTARRLLHLGAFDYVRKPFQLDLLERVLQAALGRQPG
jgi:CheY-like chemotaxis protein